MKRKSIALQYKLDWRKPFWVTNFAKTVTTSTLISSGIGLIITGLTTRLQDKGFSNVELSIGILAIITAIIIVSAIDYWAEKKEKEKIETIEEHINERAEIIAEEKILKAMEKIEKE